VLVHGFANSSRHPRVHAFAHELARRVPVVVPDLRGHGASAGATTLGLREPLDVAAAVQLAASLAPGRPVVTVGTSLGGIAVLRHAGAIGGVAGTVGISTPAWWGAKDGPSSARLNDVLASPAGRAVLRALFATRVPARLDAVPDAADVIGAIAPAFTLLVHDPDDAYFGPHHAEQLLRWAADPKELWLEPGIGHGVDVLTPAFAGRLLDALDARLSAAPRAVPGA
jgi:pimeloyl-ACP methyl ester carboxylesterase